MEDLKKIGLEMKVARVRKGLTQMELSKQSGVALCTVSFIEQGIANPRLSTLLKLAKALDLDEDKIIEMACGKVERIDR